MQYSEFNRHMISIHAPRRGERPTSFAMVANCTPFQSTLPAGGATPRESAQRLEHLFQSTLPAGGATTDIAIKAIANMISIHAPRMGSDRQRRASDNKRRISIHAPRMGSGQLVVLTMFRLSTFQSTLPAWGATFHNVQNGFGYKISIHAPRMGSDQMPDVLHDISLLYFNPRSPHGERRPPLSA